MKNQEITLGDSVTYNFADGTKVVQPITKEGLLNIKGNKKSLQDIHDMLSTTMIDKGAISYAINADSNEVITSNDDLHFTAKERYNAKKDYKDFQKENPAGFANSLKQFRAMVIDKFTNTKMKVRMNVTVIKS